MLLITVSLGVLGEFLGKPMLVQIVENFHDLEWGDWVEYFTGI